MHPLFTGQVAAWKSLHDLFWKIAKESDVRTQAFFVDDWDVLCQFVLDNVPAGDKRDKAIVWLEWIGSRAEKWAARYTWGIRSWGIHSTQRAEAIQRVIKIYVRSTSRVTDMLNRIIENNDNARHQKQIDEIRHAMRQCQAGIGLQMPDYVQRRAQTLTPYGVELICAQMSRQLLYHVKEVLESGDFIVAMRTSILQDPTLEYDEDGNVSIYRSDYDFGLSDCLSRAPTEGRLVSRDLKSCSCQLPNCLGVACTHILAACAFRNSAADAVGNVELPESLFGPLWMRSSRADREEALTALLRVPVPRPAAPTRAICHLSRNDRRVLLLEELQVIVEAGSLSDNDMMIVRSSIPAILAAIANNKPLTAQAEAHEDESDAEHEEEQEPVLFVRDASSFHQMLQDEWEAYPLLPKQTTVETYYSTEWHDYDENKDSMVGRMIGYKFAAAGAGGWFMGKIVERLSDQFAVAEPVQGSRGARKCCNFEVDYDDGRLKQTLFRQNYCLNVMNPKVPIDSWVLLRPKSLGEQGLAGGLRSGTVKPPAVKTKRGGQRSKRAGPAHGPMSKRKR